MTESFITKFILPVVFLLTGCTHLFYYPNKDKIYYQPQQVNLKPEDIYFDSQDGNKIHGWWFAAADAKRALGTIVYFHGNAENLTSHFVQLSWIPERGYNYFIFDYPGYGKSEGEPTPYGNLQSALAAIRWVHKNKDSRPLIILGHSLGGSIALRAVVDIKDEIPIRDVIIDASFISYRGIARYKLSQSKITWLLQPIGWLLVTDRYTAKGRISEISPIPLLVIHGQADKIVEPRFGEELFSQAGEPKQIWRIENGTHGDTFWSHNRTYRDKFIDYLKSRQSQND